MFLIRAEIKPFYFFFITHFPTFKRRIIYFIFFNQKYAYIFPVWIYCINFLHKRKQFSNAINLNVFFFVFLKEKWRVAVEEKITFFFNYLIQFWTLQFIPAGVAPSLVVFYTQLLVKRESGIAKRKSGRQSGDETLTSLITSSFQTFINASNESSQPFTSFYSLRQNPHEITFLNQ